MSGDMDGRMETQATGREPPSQATLRLMTVVNTAMGRHRNVAYRNKALVVEQAREQLEAGADPNYVSAGGTVPLKQAVEGNSDDLVRLLCQYGANPNWIPSQRAGPLLVRAIGRQRSKVAMALIDAGAVANTADFMGRTPLHMLCGVRMNNQMMDRLLAIGADPLARTSAGQTPLEVLFRQWQLSWNRREEKLTPSEQRGLMALMDAVGAVLDPAARHDLLSAVLEPSSHQMVRHGQEIIRAGLRNALAATIPDAPRATRRSRL